MIYNIDFDKLKNLGTSNYCNSESNPNFNKIATLGINNYCNEDGIWNMEEVLCLFVRKINELIDSINSMQNDIDELKKQVELLIKYVKLLLEYIKNLNIDLSDYYTKGQVDALLDELRKLIENVDVDLSNYYTKAEVDALLKDINVDLSNYFTKQQTLDEIKKAMTEKKPAQIYKFYTDIDILENNTFIRGDVIFFNFKVKKNNSTHFSANNVYKIGRFSYKPVNYTSNLYGTSKSNSTGRYTSLVGVQVDGTGDISITVNQNSTECIITGQVPLLIPVSGIPTPTTPPTVIPSPEFVEKLPYQIYDDLLKTQGYIIEDENGVQHTLKHNTRRIRFIISAIGGLEHQTDYELSNMWGDYRGFDEVRRILSYTFTWDEVNFIMDQWTSRSDENLITIVVRDKAIRWNNVSGIGVGILTV